MIRQKPRLIIAFPSTTQAIDMERKCRAAGPDQENALRTLIGQEAIKTEGIYIL